METNQPIDEDMGQTPRLPDSFYSDLKTAGGWAMFLAVLGFVGVAILLLTGIGMSAFSVVGSGDNEFSDALPFSTLYLGVMYLVLGAIYVVPVLYLFRFAQKAREAGRTFAISTVEDGVRFLRKHYQITGIMVILLMVLYIVGIFAFIAFGMSMSGQGYF